MQLSPLNAYYGMAIAHARQCFSVCVAKDTGQVKKDEKLSWKENNPQDINFCISRLLNTIGEVAKLQLQEQSHLPSDFWYSIPFVIGLHDTPEDYIDSELSQIKIYPETQPEDIKNIKEEKGRRLVYNKLLGIIETGEIDDFPFSTSLGIYYSPNKNDLIAAIESVEGTLKNLYEEVARNDELSNMSMLGLQMFAKQYIQAAIQQMNETTIQIGLHDDRSLSFIQLPHGIGEYLNLPEVIVVMKNELKKQGLDPDKIEIKFPTEEKSDFYFNVLKPNMEHGVNEHKKLLQGLNDNPLLLKLFQFAQSLKA